MLCCVICGQNQPYKWVYEIKSFTIPNGETKKYFPDNAVLIEELDNSIYAVENSDIVLADIEKAEINFHGRYKIKNQYIKGAIV